MVLVDANVILELLLNRKRTAQAAAVLGAIGRPYTTTLTAHLVWHFGRFERMSDAVIAEHLAAYDLLALMPADYAWALANEQGRDFEDALQVAVAVNNDCDQFITFDRRLTRRYARLPLKFVVPAA